MREFAADPEQRRAWARTARQIAVSRFSASRMVDEMVEVYRAVLSRNNLA